MRSWKCRIAALASLAPVSLLCWWEAQSRRAPDLDTYTYGEAALRILHSGTISAFYFERAWKPMLLPALAAAAMLVPPHHFFAAAFALKLLFFSGFLLYTFRLWSRRFSAGSALLATWFFGTFPWVLGSAYLFDSDMPYFCSLAGFFHHFLRSRENGSRRCLHALIAGVWLGVALDIRPLEGTLLLAPLAIWHLFSERKARHLEGKDFIALAALLIPPGLASVVFGNQYRDPHEQQLFLTAICGYGAILLILALRHSISRRLWVTGTAAYFCIAGWWGPFFYQLRVWGNMALLQTDPGFSNLGLLSRIAKIFWITGGIALVILVPLALASAARSGHRLRLRLGAVAVAIAFLSDPVLGSLREIPVYRYYFGSTLLLLGLLLWIVLGSSRWIHATGLALLFLLSCGHLAFEGSLLIPKAEHSYWVGTDRIDPGPGNLAVSTLVPAVESPPVDVLDFLAREIPDPDGARVMLLNFGPPNIARGPAQLINPSAMAVHAWDRGIRSSVVFPTLDGNLTPSQALEKIVASSSYIAILPPPARSVPTGKLRGPLVRLIEDARKRRQLARMGLKELGFLELHMQGATQDFRLLSRTAGKTKIPIGRTATVQ